MLVDGVRLVYSGGVEGVGTRWRWPVVVCGGRVGSPAVS